MELEAFGRKLSRLRNAADLTQEKLAEEVDVSSVQLISKWERSHKKPGREKMVRLVEIFADHHLIGPEEARRWALQADHELTQAELQNIFPNYLPSPPQQIFKRPWQHPPLPNHYLNRTEIEQKIYDFLLRASPQQTLVLSGPGGVGKSTLASWAANEVGEHFGDGVLWFDYSTGNGVFEIQAQIAGSFNFILSQASLAERAKELRSLLHEKQCLLVLDDAWGEADLIHLKIHNHHCPMLITTRDKAVAHIFDAGPPLEVAGLTPEEGQALLELLAGPDVTPEQMAELIGKVEGHPLALTLMGALLHMGFTFAELWHEFQGEPIDLTILEIGGDPKNRFTSLNRCFDLSYERLPSAEMRQYFAQAGYFVGVFTEEAAAKLWGTKLDQARRVLHQFVRFNLITRRAEGYRLHALLRDYARQRLSFDWADLEQTTCRRHAAYYILYSLYHPQILEGNTDEGPPLDQSWSDGVAGVTWACSHAPELAAIAVLVAHTERQPLLKAIGAPLLKAVETYLSIGTNREEQAVLHELLGDLYLLNVDNQAAFSHFERASRLWLAEENNLAAGRAKLRTAGVLLILQDRQQAATITREAQALLEQSLPIIRENDLGEAHRLFYWFNIVYSALVKWEGLPEGDVATFSELARKTGQPKLEARGLHIHRLWCTAPGRSQVGSMRQKARQLAARAAWLWYRGEERDKAEAEVMWTQEYTKGRRSRRLALAFARRRARLTPELSRAQIDLVDDEETRRWLAANEDQRAAWLVQKMPLPGRDDWQKLDYILNLGIRGKSVRRLVPGIPRPDDHILSEPMWRVLTGQKVLSLSGEAAAEVVRWYRARLEEEIRD